MTGSLAPSVIPDGRNTSMNRQSSSAALGGTNGWITGRQTLAGCEQKYTVKKGLYLEVMVAKKHTDVAGVVPFSTNGS